jgi:hypothetical protein
MNRATPMATGVAITRAMMAAIRVPITIGQM